mmetsp:Transcript_12727/g.29018  ORF Transcript_12727/g.29018 Transcript_12727/m.29018 type:complete len:95 (-) Transcript_12727:1638-1922(-)
MGEGCGMTDKGVADDAGISLLGSLCWDPADCDPSRTPQIAERNLNVEVDRDQICFLLNAELVWWMMFSRMPMTVKTPPTIAQVDVKNLYQGTDS